MCLHISTISAYAQEDENNAKRFKLYTYAPEVESSEFFSVSVNDQPCKTISFTAADVAVFEMRKSVEISVKSLVTDIEKVDIRPKSADIKFKVSGNKIIFKLKKARNLSVEINGDIARPLFIFANKFEKQPPTKDDANVIFFEAGKVHDVGAVKLKSGDTLYVEGGAIVRGKVSTARAENIKIMGRGIFNAGHFQKGAGKIFEMGSIKNLLIKDLIGIDATGWSCPLYGCDGVVIDNIKLVSNNIWDDGIDVCRSKNVVVKNCFLRTRDDCIAIKGTLKGYKYCSDSYDVDNIEIRDSTFWNGNAGNGLEIGYETPSQTISNIKFENIDLIHVETRPGNSSREATFTIHNGDRATVSNVLYKNIRVEDPTDWLIDFRIMNSRYTVDKQTRGKIENIRFEDIFVTSTMILQNSIEGFDDAHMVKNITIKNMIINGEKITDQSQLNLIKSHAEDLKFVE